MRRHLQLPDQAFGAAQRHARRARKSLSKVMAEALSEYLARHSPDPEATNQVIDQLDEPTDPFVTAAAQRILKRNQW